MRYLLHDVLSEAVAATPNKVAVREESGRQYTYAEINRLSNQFAAWLSSVKLDIRQQPYLGILAPVHGASIAAALGILKIGGAYVPLDDASPADRLMAILTNTGLEVLVVDAHLFESYRDLIDFDGLQHVIVLGDLPAGASSKVYGLSEITNLQGEETPQLNQVSDDLAYILHSSGSTGVPKGIMLTHRNARTFVDWMHKEFALTAEDVVMSRAPFKFDLSVFDIFNTFKAGATLICYDWNKFRDGDAKHREYVDLIKRERATILYTTPSVFISLMNRGGLGEAGVALREVMYAGEPFPTPLLRKLQSALPKTRIANIYGPTETNIITYFWLDELPSDDSPVPLGYVVDDTEILVVSSDGARICNENEMGELWCRGGTVTLGYLNMDEKTSKCLVRSPFHPYPAWFWRTGDFGYRDSAGRLHYRGRQDHMVKVKGYRIEIGEVEAGLAKMPQLDEFVVVAVPDDKYGNRLYCYFAALPGQKVTAAEVQAFLEANLPSYMVPYRFEARPALPKTSSGKVDRVLLAKEAAA